MVYNEALVSYYFQKFFVAMFKRDKTILDQSIIKLNQLSKEDKEAFKILGSYRLKYFKKMYLDYKNDSFTRSFDIQLPKLKEITFKIDREFRQEEDLKQFIASNNVLEKSFDMKLWNREHPTLYGNIDHLYVKNRQYIPCEIKLGTGRHDLITQIEKYIHSFWLWQHYNVFNEVFGITLAKDYDDFSLKELKKLDVIILTYHLDNDKFYLLEVNKNEIL